MGNCHRRQHHVAQLEMSMNEETRGMGLTLDDSLEVSVPPLEGRGSMAGRTTHARFLAHRCKRAA